MGTIFQKTRIRERHNRLGKALVYSPTLPHKKTMEDAVDSHNWAWAWLGANRQKVVPPKWMKDLVNRLLLDKKSNWEGVIKDLEPLIEDPVYAAKPGEKVPAPPKDPLDYETAITAYARSMGLDHYSQGFPPLDKRVVMGNGKYPGHTLVDKEKLIKRDLIEELLVSGTLMANVARKEPKKIYSDFMVYMPKESIAVLRIRVREIQALLAMGRLWLEFGNTLEVPIKSLAELRENHAKSYQAWRKTHRMGLEREGVQEISKRMIKGEIQYMRNILDRAESDRLIPSNPFRKIVLKGFSKDVRAAAKDKPYTVDELESLLKWAKKHWEDCSEATPRDIEWKKDRELNFLTMVFLSCTGCRPKEVGQWVLDGKQVEFNGGKTKSAHRIIDVSRTLSKVVSNPLFQKNKETMGISTRLGNYLKRHKGPGVSSRALAA